MLSELSGLNEQWNSAWLQKDAATVEHLMADDYIYVAPNGLVLDRQAILGIIRSPSYRLDHAIRTDVVVRTVGQEVAIVRHRSQAAGSFEGTSFTDDHRCVMICEKQAGEWRIVMEQHSFGSK
jgi:ketosteroid isomerase-like protein